MTELDTEGIDGDGAPKRPTAASVIADLWTEREHNAPPLPPPPVAGRRGSAGRPPRPLPAGSPGDGGERRTAALVAVVAVALLLGAGLGVFIASRGIGRPSTATFLANAEAACRAGADALTPLAKPTSYPELVTATTAAVTATQAQLDGLRRLRLPAGATGERAGVALAGIAGTNVAARELQETAGRMDDAATASATERLRAAASDGAAAARELGLAGCAAVLQPGLDPVVGGGAEIVKTAFVAKADTLCRAGARAMEGVAPPRSNNRDVGRYLGETLLISEKLVADLKALPVPPGDTSVIGEALTTLDTANGKWREARDAALGNDPSRFVAIEQELVVLGTAADAKLDAYGLTSCGSHFGTR